MHEYRLTAEALPRGYVVAVCNITDVRSTEDWQPDWDSLEANMLDLEPGRWAFVLDDIRPLPEPVPCRGGRQVFRLPPGVHQRVMAQLA